MAEQLIMPLTKAYEFAASHGLMPEADKIRRATQVHPTFTKGKQVRKALMLDLFESQNLLDAFFAAHWPVGATDRGRQRRDAYNQDGAANDRLLSGEPPIEPEQDAVDMPEAEEQEFPFEADLRDFLACNLNVLEPGLRLYQDAGRTGIEFSIDDGRGRIDILALDTHDTPVVIELKLSRGRNRALGQLLYYMGWIDQNLGKGRCRGIIVAKEIPEDLVLAVRRLSDITLFRYKVAMTVEPVGPLGTTPQVVQSDAGRPTTGCS